MSDSAPSTSYKQGDVVAGKYRVDRVLGEGGMGVVLAATHVHLDQKVALKFLLPAYAGHKEVVERFLREGRAAVQIQSEHVARVLDVGATEAGSPYMVMEYLQGEDLAQLVTRLGAVPVSEAVGYILEACEAIAEAHALGIVHRDLKPANLFLAQRSSGRPTVKVLDFGISKVPSKSKDAGLTKTTALLGSPSYMSPEQLTAAPTVDHRSDVWALGIVLYEMLTGRLPFTANTMPELVGVILMNTHAPVDLERPDVPQGLKEAIDRCLQKEAGKRFANVAELARAIAPFGPRRGAQSVERIEHVLGIATEPARTEPPPAMPSATGSGVTNVPRAEGLTFTPTTSQATPARPAAGRVVIPVILALAAAGGAAFFLFRGHGQAPQAPAASAQVAASVAPAPPPSASSPPATLAPVASSEPAPSSSAVADTAPSAAPTTKVAGMQGMQGMSGRFGGWPRPSAAPPAASAPATPTCHVVAYYDADGTKHFKQECK